MQNRSRNITPRRAKPPQRRSGAKHAAAIDLTMLRLVVCVVLFSTALIMRTFFPGATETMRHRVLPMIQDGIDYRASFAVIGEGLAGEASFREVLGELYIRAFRGENADCVEAIGDEENGGGAEYDDYPPTEPSNDEPLFAIYPPIETVIPIPNALPASFLLSPSTDPLLIDEIDEVVAVFLASQAQFADLVLPVNVSFDHNKSLPLDSYTVPVSGTVSSSFGHRFCPFGTGIQFHYGVDVAADIGTPIGAFATGYVLYTGHNDTVGRYVVLSHGNGIRTRYIHCDIVYVSPGEHVERGQLIGRVGATGIVTGPHLHFELSVNGTYVNPEFYVQFS